MYKKEKLQQKMYTFNTFSSYKINKAWNMTLIKVKEVANIFQDFFK